MQSDGPVWDKFVEGSKNGTFLFMRGYMDYHQDRFTDHSLMFYNEKGKLIALLPANERDGVLYSHQGLTYGGLVLSAFSGAAEVLEMSHALVDYLRKEGFKEMLYKQMPTCYHRLPAEEDEYALWRMGAEIDCQLISTTIPLSGSTLYPATERRRKRGCARAREAGYAIEQAEDYAAFWQIMEHNLMERYGLRPVHTLEEISLLALRFPEQIRLWLAMKDGKPEAGCVAYMANDTCAHIQYGHATHQGKQDGALDLLYLTLKELLACEGYRYMDFGNSNEQGGHYLNENLIAQKEGFGGRGIVYKHWRLRL